MRYWDSSALVPLLIEELITASTRAWALADDHIVTWAMSRLEVSGAIERRAREGRLAPAARQRLLGQADLYFRSFDEVIDLLPVVERAIALRARHALRAADAAQLAAALLVAEGDPASLEFVCLDRNLAEAARREGFSILGG